jgi:hypothetical protein
MSLIRIQNFPKCMDIKSKMIIKKKYSMEYYKRGNRIKLLGATKTMFIYIYMKMN